MDSNIGAKKRKKDHSVTEEAKIYTPLPFVLKLDGDKCDDKRVLPSVQITLQLKREGGDWWETNQILKGENVRSPFFPLLFVFSFVLQERYMRFSDWGNPEIYDGKWHQVIYTVPKDKQFFSETLRIYYHVYRGNSQSSSPLLQYDCNCCEFDVSEEFEELKIIIELLA